MTVGHDFRLEEIYNFICKLLFLITGMVSRFSALYQELKYQMKKSDYLCMHNVKYRFRKILRIMILIYFFLNKAT